MNKKGQTLGIAMIIGITLFIVGMMSINFIKDEVSTVVNAENLDCADSTISDGNKLTCLAVDLVVPYFIVLVLSTAGGIIAARLLL